MIRRLLLAASVLFILGAVFAPTAKGSSLEVKDLRVEFLDGKRVRVRGVLRCRGLKPAGKPHPSSDIDVNIDFPHGKRGFSVLPDSWTGRETDAADRAEGYDIGFKPYYRFKGATYREGQRRVVFYNATHILRPLVLDQPLDNRKDDGRWIAFDKVLEFRSLKTVTGMAYRVVVGWKLSHHGAHFEHAYAWVVYGPFAWGEAPSCKQTLRATLGRSVSFTEQGVRGHEPAAEIPPDSASDPASGSGENQQRPKPARTGKRPSQLDAANASERLAAILMKIDGVENAGARANPFVGRIEVRPGAKVSGEARTALAARAAVEGAYSFPWVKTLQVVLNVSNSEVMASIPWEAAAGYAAKESTLLEFHKTWKVTGGTLPAPKAK